MSKKSKCQCISEVTTVTFNNGQEYPIIGLGTWQSKPDEVERAVKYAIDIGYRHIDSSYVCQNESAIGRAISAKVDEGVVKREELCITGKLWNTHHRRKAVESAILSTLKALQLNYLDLYLIHWPLALKERGELFPVDSEGLPDFEVIDYIETWKGMEDVVKKGFTKSIGMCNFSKRQIERILQDATIPPVVNQIECHPYLNQTKLIEFCKLKDICVIAHSPFASQDTPKVKPGEQKLLQDPKLLLVAKDYAKTPAQIALRYQVERRVMLIPKSVHKSRIEENFRIFDFELSLGDIVTIDTMDCNQRLCTYEEACQHNFYPFKQEF